MSKSGGTLYIGVPTPNSGGTCPPKVYASVYDLLLTDRTIAVVDKVDKTIRNIVPTSSSPAVE